MTDCNHDCEYACTIDEVLPYGNITSVAVFKCTKCGKEFLEGELNANRESKCSNTNKSE